MTGLARGASSNFGNYTINNLAPGKAGVLNGLHAMFSIGAFSFPIILTALTRTDADKWIYACYFIVAMGILSWLLYFLIPDPQTLEQGKTGKRSGENGFGFFREPIFYLCTFTLFFYLCAEQGVIGWLITYFEDTGLLSAALSQLMASVLWIMMLAGRLTAAWLSEKVRKERLLLIMAVGFVCFFFWLLLCRDTLLIVIGIMGFGYSMADNCVILRRADTEVFHGMELHPHNSQLWFYPDAYDHRQDCRECGYFLWNEFHCGSGAD